jgi:hypothetical protein
VNHQYFDWYSILESWRGCSRLSIWTPSRTPCDGSGTAWIAESELLKKQKSVLVLPVCCLHSNVVHVPGGRYVGHPEKNYSQHPIVFFLWNRHPDLILPPVGTQIPNVLCGSPLLMLSNAGVKRSKTRANQCLGVNFFNFFLGARSGDPHKTFGIWVPTGGKMRTGCLQKKKNTIGCRK